MTTRNRIFSALITLPLIASAPAAAADRLEQVCGDCVIEKVAECGGFLEGATVSADGTVWVMDLTGDRILELQDGQCIERGRAGGTPNGAKFRDDGSLLILGRLGLLSFDPASGSITPLLTEVDGVPLASPNDLALDSAGGIYMTEVRGSSLFNRTGRVLYLAPDGSPPQVLAEGIAFPNGIAISADERNVLVSEFATKRILSIMTPIATPGLSIDFVYANTSGGFGADGILVDGQGRLFTAQIGAGTVQVFAADGTEIGTLNLPEEAGALVTNFAIADDYLYITEAALGEVWRVRLIN